MVAGGEQVDEDPMEAGEIQAETEEPNEELPLVSSETRR